MILIESGSSSKSAFDAKIVFADQLNQSGVSSSIDEVSIPSDLTRNQKYDALPYARPVVHQSINRLLIIGPESVDDAVLSRLRRFATNTNLQTTVIGRFDTPQEILSASSKISYVLGKEPSYLDLTGFQTMPILANAHLPTFGIEGEKTEKPADIPKLLIFVPADLLEQPGTLEYLVAINHDTDLNLQIVTTGQGQNFLRGSRYSELTSFGYSELLPSTLSQVFDIAIFCGPNIPGERMAQLAMNMFSQGKPVIDCTETASFAVSGAPALRGPVALAGLANYLRGRILPHLANLRQMLNENSWVAENLMSRLICELALPSSPQSALKSGKKQLFFIPTNGVGLGHAQRCCLIADRIQHKTHPKFAAFPSCLPMVNENGFDALPLVSKSPEHTDQNANDVLNYGRLRNTLRARDHLVFDGGYIFDSLTRLILEKNLSATWIRRGLWQAGQRNNSNLERENIFKQVIVPAECFNELNRPVSFTEAVHNVGPIVQSQPADDTARITTRERLKSQFETDFTHLTVTMLGGGVAADRSAQLQMLCAQFERRQDCLNLILLWPNALVSPSLYNWKNSRVVRTKHALRLCLASDLIVSAVGYNSFHEILYHQLPAIFVPQMAAYMDDQEKRARAASDRGAAITILAQELLLLERAVTDCLDNDKTSEIRTALADLNLPEPGNTAAARLIEKAAFYEQ